MVYIYEIARVQKSQQTLLLQTELLLTVLIRQWQVVMSRQALRVIFQLPLRKSKV